MIPARPRIDPSAQPQLTPIALALQIGLQIGLLSMALATASAQAQEPGAAAAPAPPPPEEPATTLPTVTVKPATDKETAIGPVTGNIARRSATGTKTDTPLIETPQSVSVLTADRIQVLGGTQIRDALAYTPGVNAAPFGHDSRYEWINLRGFNGYAPGFFLDGMILRNNGNFAAWRTEAYGAERIEVLRGPASVLYGQGSPGGMVNVVSKRPTAEPLREFQVQGGSASSRQVSGDFSGPLSADGEWLYRITGLVRNAEIPDSGLPDDRVFIAPSLTWRPSADTTLTLLSHGVRNRAGIFWSGYPVAGTLEANPNGPISAARFIGEPGFEQFNQDQWALGYALEHRLDDTWTLRQNLRHGHHETDMRGTSSGGFVTVNDQDLADPANFRLVNRYVTASKEDVSAFMLDNQAQAKLRSGQSQHTLLVGLDYQRSKFDGATRGGTTDPIDVYAPVHGGSVVVGTAYVDGTATLKQAGLYVQDQVRWADRWVATLGGRYDRYTVDALDRLPDSGPVPSESGSQWTSRAGLVYLADGGWAPYVSYSESFFPTTVLAPDTGTFYKPETGRQYEAGVRYQPAGGNATYSAGLFDIRRQNYLTYDSTFTPRQTGEVHVRGLELEAILRSTSQMNLTAAYSWTPTAEITASSTPSEIGTQENPVPKHQLSLWADYRFAEGTRAGLGARYVGSTQGAGEAQFRQLPSYALFDAMVGRDIGAWSLALNVRNLADKTYVTTCGLESCYYGDLRRFTATATYRW